MDEREYRRRWEESLEKRLDDLHQSTMRVKGDVGDLSGELKVKYVELHEMAHDSLKGIRAIGAKLDILDEQVKASDKKHLHSETRADIQLKWAELSDLADKFGMIRKAIWAFIITGCIGLFVWGIRQGIIG